MSYEVEQKFYVDALSAVEDVLRRLGSSPGAPTTQVDTYFSHPARDFHVTDEALRLRRIDDINRITYKGPKIDRTTKTRRELELELPRGAEFAAGYQELLSLLGFEKVIDVRKERRETSLPWRGWVITVSLDTVDGLGSFVELELQTDDKDLERARQALAACAAELGLHRNERLSYCELLLQRRAETASGAS
jgi:adenylate cyclase class 2